MSRLLTVILLFSFMASPLIAQDKAGPEADKQAIRKAALHYIEGWYQGDPGRMQEALHPNLAKRRIHILEKTGTAVLDDLTAYSLVEYTRAGYGKLESLEEAKIELQILDVYKNIACVKIVSKDFIDYLHLARFNGEWKIINVLWEPVK